MRLTLFTTEKFKIIAIVFVVVTTLLLFFAYAHAQTPSTKNVQDDSSYTSSSKLQDEQDVIPYGVPDTGFGGSTQLERMNANAALPLLAFVFILLVGFGVLYTVKDGKKDRGWI